MVTVKRRAVQVNWSLKVTGTAGCLEVSRGGWSGNRGTYVLTWKSVLDAVSQSKTFSFSGVNNAFTAFTALVVCFVGEYVCHISSHSLQLHGV